MNFNKIILDYGDICYLQNHKIHFSTYIVHINKTMSCLICYIVDNRYTIFQVVKINNSKKKRREWTRGRNTHAIERNLVVVYCTFHIQPIKVSKFMEKYQFWVHKTDLATQEWRNLSRALNEYYFIFTFSINYKQFTIRNLNWSIE